MKLHEETFEEKRETWTNDFINKYRKIIVMVIKRCNQSSILGIITVQIYLLISIFFSGLFYKSQIERLVIYCLCIGFGIIGISLAPSNISNQLFPPINIDPSLLSNNIFLRKLVGDLYLITSRPSISLSKIIENSNLTKLSGGLMVIFGVLLTLRSFSIAIILHLFVTSIHIFFIWVTYCIYPLSQTK